MEATTLDLPPAIVAYLRDVIDTCSPPRGPLVGLVLFGSAATGGYTGTVSDVDLLLLVHDDADAEARERVVAAVASLEEQHGVGKRSEPSGRLPRLRGVVDRLTANGRAFFVCRRADLLSGAPARILGIPAAQAVFVDRVAVPSIVRSGVTVWGEDLLAAVPLQPIRRLDVLKSCFSLCNQVLLAAAVFPVLSTATGYAMDALKRAVHCCYFCHRGSPAPLAEEIAYFEQRYGPSSALARLLELRRRPAASAGFLLSCLPAIALLHARTLRDAPLSA